MEARSNPLPAEKSLQDDRTLVSQDRLVPACRVLSFRSQAARVVLELTFNIWCFLEKLMIELGTGLRRLCRKDNAS